MTRPTRRARSNSRSDAINTNANGQSASDSNQATKRKASELSPSRLGRLLSAVKPNGESIFVKIRVNGALMNVSDNSSPQQTNGSRTLSGRKLSSRISAGSPIVKHNGETFVQSVLGDDGNLYYCDFCREVGDVVCCDSCPRVYHPTCIPEESQSRKSLDADEDPWHCPTCMREGKRNNQGSVSKSNSNDQHGSRRKNKRCIECQNSKDGNIGQCKICHAAMHIPSCRNQHNVLEKDVSETCSNCLAKFVVEEEEEEYMRERKAPQSKRKRSIEAEADKGITSESSISMSPKPPPSYGKKIYAKSKVSANNTESPVRETKGTDGGVSGNNISNKKKKSSTSSLDSDEAQSPYKILYSHNVSPVKRNLPDKATSPFFLFLVENRIKLERHLSRKNRSFKRLKGYNRNLLLSKEGAQWWAKTSKIERKKYVDIALQEFEYNVLMWKEEETVREMMFAEGTMDQSLDSEENNIVTSDLDNTEKDKDYWAERFNNLVSPSSVHCRKIKASSELIQNRVLLELLQDTRFHSLPMMKPNRQSLFETQDNSKMAVPYFNIQGPIATSIGDTCLGCSRGWNHFCPILKRQFPAVEHRAKLQPPCPSHLTVRTGIGLPSSDDTAKRYSYSEKKKKELRFLSCPSKRSDEIMKLVETAMAAKLPIDKIDKTKEGDSVSEANSTSLIFCNGSIDNDLPERQLYECGRCKAITTSKMGCVTCRRVKLLVGLSKGDPRDDLTVQTVMLRRMNARTDDFCEQTEGEKKIAHGLVKRPWQPNAILPPSKKAFPSKHPSLSHDESSSDDETSDSDSSSSDESEVVSLLENGDDEKSKEEVHTDTLVCENDPAPNDEPAPKRQRVTRSTISKTNEETLKNESSRQAKAEVHKIEADQVNTRCLSIATCGILLSMIRRDPLRLFAEPVLESVEGYHKIIKKPMDLQTIKDKVLNRQYSSLGAFMSDARLLCINSLIYNPPGTIYSMTAEEIKTALEKAYRHASQWMAAIKNSHASHYTRKHANISMDMNNDSSDPFYELRKTWPGAAELLEDDGRWLRSQVAAEFVRTKENEYAYYATIAIRRAAKAAEASLAPIFESDTVFNPCARRSHIDDEELRDYINHQVTKVSDPSQITNPSSWREQDVLELLKKVQRRRVETKTSPEDGCSRCESISIDDEANKLARETAVIRKRRKTDGVQVRVHDSRRRQSNGMASKRERDRVLSSQNGSTTSIEAKSATARDRSVTVRGSGIQGWGLFADHSFKKGELVAEYVGEYVVNPMADKREKFYEDSRIQDYQFRVSATLVIDATKLGGHARYINHSCEPSCIAKIIDGEPPNQHLKRVIVTSQRDIQAGEEITYDYQFPLELDLDARIPCNCGAKNCRGFMNWDLPEIGSLVARASTRQGRRDRIRRLVNKAL
mmetsp:Transcript_9651/g.11238  ORF Transcript_9651/g.11238 Transcript_9651/m.11238 type:complete len:1400 (+) Transcript_9651:363-4562(+)